MKIDTNCSCNTILGQKNCTPRTNGDCTQWWDFYGLKKPEKK